MRLSRRRCGRAKFSCTPRGGPACTAHESEIQIKRGEPSATFN
jgi:hypothetical protein